jgi:hypothetical protein
LPQQALRRAFLHLRPQLTASSSGESCLGLVGSPASTS